MEKQHTPPQWDGFSPSHKASIAGRDYAHVQTYCAYCQADATHILYANQSTHRWEPRAPMPGRAPSLCVRCATALAAGESGEALAARLNREVRTGILSYVEDAVIEEDARDQSLSEEEDSHRDRA